MTHIIIRICKTSHHMELHWTGFYDYCPSIMCPSIPTFVMSQTQNSRDKNKLGISRVSSFLLIYFELLALIQELQYWKSHFPCPLFFLSINCIVHTSIWSFQILWRLFLFPFPLWCQMEWPFTIPCTRKSSCNKEAPVLCWAKHISVMEKSIYV